jgi:hypothetical protein
MAMAVSDDEFYQKCVEAFEVVVISIVNDVLRANQCDDEVTRRRICEEFISTFINFVDCYWVAVADRKIRPVIQFRELRSTPTETPSDGFGQLYDKGRVSSALSTYFDELDENIASWKYGIDTSRFGKD